ncbi:MAG: MGMT family protein [Candidatus Omnitrophota bacterium]
MTSFEKKVYTVVKRIPAGETRSYAWVAREIGSPKAVRAVGRALNNNPYPLIVPCHRVIHSDGRLGEYVFGSELKKRLLETERLC